MLKIIITNTINSERHEYQVEKSTAIIGRSEKCDVTISNDYLSRQHCLIEVQDESLFITDLNSSNGITINDRKIPSEVRTSFNRYDHILIGPFECSIDYVSAEIELHPSQPKNYTAPSSSHTLIYRREEPKKKINNKLLIFLPVFIMAVFILLQIKTQTEEVSTPEEVFILEKEPPLPSITISPEAYRENLNNKTCTGIEDQCNTLNIDETIGEGITSSSENYFIYLSPTRWLNTEVKYEEIKQLKEASDLLAMDHLITSPLFSEFLEGRIKKIHLIILSSNGIQLRSYLFDSELFLPHNLSIPFLLSGIDKAISNKTPEQFWQDYSKVILRKEL